MKKRCIFKILISLLVISILVSCSSTATFEDETEEYDYALHYALSSSNENAISNLYFKITDTTSFLPLSLNFIADKASQIPGMPKLLSEWTSYMSSYTLQWFEELKTYLNSLVNEMSFENPIETVNKSDCSASEDFEETYKAEIKAYIKQNLEKAKLSKWDEIETQYKAWVETRMVLFDENNTPLEDVDLLEDLADYTCNLYFSSLKEFETLLRTTPDPNADETVSKVFGLD